MMRDGQRKELPTPATNTCVFDPCAEGGNKLPSKTAPCALYLPGKMRATSEDI
jgi:hypothetical protein